MRALYLMRPALTALVGSPFIYLIFNLLSIWERIPLGVYLAIFNKISLDIYHKWGFLWQNQ